jgi:hypothetical protein
MRDVVEYLRAYRAYISANLGWGKALRFALVWIAGMFVPWVSKTLIGGRQQDRHCQSRARLQQSRRER